MTSLNCIRISTVVLALVFGGCSENAEVTPSAPNTTDAHLDELLDMSIQRDVAQLADAESAEEDQQVGFELIEVQSPNNIRAWISPQITFDEFAALEVPMGWIKNQPRESPECGADAVRFIRSPDSMEDGDILIEEHFGFNWFHSASITQMNVPIDEAGLLRGVVVRKFHELTYNSGSCIILLTAPNGDVYFRVGRAADRTTDDPTLPDQWRLERYITPEEVVIELFGENTVIRTDNQDSFQGPVPQLQMRSNASDPEGTQ